MEVVELPDRGDAGREHLAKEPYPVLDVIGRFEVLGRTIHLIPPFPEVTATSLDTTSQRTLESMAVHVGQAWDGPTLQQDGFARRGHAFGDRFDSSIANFDKHVAGRVAEPRLFGVPDAASVQSFIG